MSNTKKILYTFTLTRVSSHNNKFYIFWLVSMNAENNNGHIHIYEHRMRIIKLKFSLNNSIRFEIVHDFEKKIVMD